MKHVTTLFLKIALFMIALPALALSIFWLPGFIGYINIAIILLVYVTELIYFFALYKAFKLLQLIDKNKAFSYESVDTVKHIKYCAYFISGIFVVILPFLYPIADADDSPGLLAFPLIIVFASLVISTFAAVLQKLLYEALIIKNDNDLTV